MKKNLDLTLIYELNYKYHHYHTSSWTRPNTLIRIHTIPVYFMPYQEVGLVKNATKDALISIKKCENDERKIVLYTTAAYKQVRVILQNTEKKKIYLDI